MKNDSRIKHSQLVFILLSFVIVMGRVLLDWFETPELQEEFSLPLQVTIAILGVGCSIFGIWMLRHVLLRFFSDGIVAVTMVLIVLGSNYFQLTVFNSALAHTILFTLYALIVWLTIRWHEMPHRKYAISLGVAIGLVILIRPAGSVILLIPLLWGIFDKESWQRKRILIRSNLSQVLLFLLFLATVVFLPILFGKSLVDFLHSGNEPDEKLRWIAPYLWQVLFSFEKGWLIYAPMMVFPLIGFYFLAEKNKAIFFSTFLFFLVNLAVVAGWPAWWQGKIPGQPALMASGVILAIPFGYFLQWIVSLKPVVRVPFYLVFLFFILLNLFQTWQGMKSLNDTPNKIKEDYFLKNASKYNIRVLNNYDFEKGSFPASGNLVTEVVKNGQYAFRMDTGTIYSPGLQSAYAELSKKSPLGIRVTAWIYSRVPFLQNPGSLVVTSNHEGLNYNYETISFEKEKLNPGLWNKVTMYYLTPESPDPADIIQVYVWYRGNSELFVDDLKIELFEPKE